MRQPRLGFVPKFLFHRTGSGIAFDSGVSGQHPLDVAIEDGRNHVVGEGGDGGGGAATDAGQFRKQIDVGGKARAMLRNDLLCSAMQVARAAVVAEPGPVREHLVFGRVRQCSHIREAINKSHVIRQHRCHLCLLKHDFGQPDAIRVTGVLPGQIVATVDALPGDQADGEGGIVVAHRLATQVNALTMIRLCVGAALAAI